MRIKQSKARADKIAPASLPRHRRRRVSPGSRARQPDLLVVQKNRGPVFDATQWLISVCVLLAAMSLIVLLWILTQRTIAEQTTEVRLRADQYIRTVASVLAREVQTELALVDQTLKIIEEDWKRDSSRVDLGQWAAQASALTAVSQDIFIADEHGVIVQGTLPESLGKGFGTSYMTVPNGTPEVFEADGTKNQDERVPGQGLVDRIEARQFLIYVVRPLNTPRGWMVGASYRSDGITKFFATAKLGPGSIVGLADTDRGALVALVGSPTRLAEMDIARSTFADLLRKNGSGVWTGESPTDNVFRIMAYQRVPGRNMAVVTGIPFDQALRSIDGTIEWTRGIAVMGSLTILAAAAIIIWVSGTARHARSRRREAERTELSLMNAKRELTVARVQAMLTEPEVGTLMSSTVDGVARLDEAQRLRAWNQRFAELAGVILDVRSTGVTAEQLLRAQAEAGLFGNPRDADDQVAARLTVLHTSGQSVVPPPQTGPAGEMLTMQVRGVIDGGNLIVLISPENARYAAMPPLEAADQPEPVEEATEW